MKSNSIHISAVLAALSTYASATCKTFKQVGKVYFVTDLSQMQTVSQGVVCNNASDTWNTCSRKSDPSDISCAIDARGFVTAKGFTNLSISDTDAESLFGLVSSSYNLTVAAGVADKSLYSSVGGCLNSFLIPGASNEAIPRTCIKSGEAAYLRFAPELACVDGKFEDCTDNAPVKNGTGLSLCGAMNVANMNFTYNGTHQYYGALPMHNNNYSVVLTNATFAATVQDTANATNATCANLSPGWQMAAAAAASATATSTSTATATPSSVANGQYSVTRLAALPAIVMVGLAMVGGA